MNTVYDTIMNKNPEKKFDDEMWIHNCYNEDLNIRIKNLKLIMPNFLQ